VGVFCGKLFEVLRRVRHEIYVVLGLSGKVPGNSEVRNTATCNKRRENLAQSVPKACEWELNSCSAWDDPSSVPERGTPNVEIRNIKLMCSTVKDGIQAHKMSPYKP
jgi:hypothetical protein